MRPHLKHCPLGFRPLQRGPGLRRCSAEGLPASASQRFIHRLSPHLPVPLLQRRPELQMVSEGLHAFASRTPFLEWFVRGPDGRPRARPQQAFITDAPSANDDGRRR